MESLKTRYEKADVNVERIKAQLEDHQVVLMKDIAMLDKMYQLNLVYFKELTMYILAGRKKLEQVRTNDLKAANDKAQRTQLPEDAQAARDLADMCDRFEKKLYDLQLTRNISIQMGPQIRLIQANDTMMAEKIQTTIVNTIPPVEEPDGAGAGHGPTASRAMEAERAVTDATNELLRKKCRSPQAGHHRHRPGVRAGRGGSGDAAADQRELIATLDELNKIRADGKAKRAAAEQELGRIGGRAARQTDGDNDSNMQLEQQETFRIEGPQLELLGQAESKLARPGQKNGRWLLRGPIVLGGGAGGCSASAARKAERRLPVHPGHLCLRQRARPGHGQRPGPAGGRCRQPDPALRPEAGGQQDAAVQAARQALDAWNATNPDHPADSVRRQHGAGRRRHRHGAADPGHRRQQRCHRRPVYRISFPAGHHPARGGQRVQPRRPVL